MSWYSISSRVSRPRGLTLVLLAFALFAATAPAALADSTQSSNWAGYAVHRSGVRFTKVVGAWRQPTTTCTAGSPAYSSAWVGLGGYSQTSKALEQIGSEADCNASGKVVSSLWYEIVPAASRTIRVKVNPGDELTASVTVTGHSVRLQIDDLTRHRSFTKTVHASTVDVSSADWILEAPSECADSFSCRTLTLADFGSTTFIRASAVTTSGHTGRIADGHWNATKITLAASGRPFISSTANSGAVSASPSPLAAQGSSFTVTYKASSAPASPTSNTRRRASTTMIVRPRFMPR